MIAKRIRKELDDVHYLEEWTIGEVMLRKEADVVSYMRVAATLGIMRFYVNGVQVSNWDIAFREGSKCITDEYGEVTESNDVHINIKG